MLLLFRKRKVWLFGLVLGLGAMTAIVSTPVASSAASEKKASKEEKEFLKEIKKALKNKLKGKEDKKGKDADVPLIGPLDSVPVPLPPDLKDYVDDEKAAIALGKALFWDMQVGSDGRTACATCHFHAGADSRTKNTVAPNGGSFRGANYQLTSSDFPFHRLADPDRKRSNSNPVIFDTSEIAGAQGVIKKEFVRINDGSPVDVGILVPDPVFHFDGANARQVTGRNSPSVINAVFNDRQFWDGRANRFFNGVNPFGDMDPDARVWVTASKKGGLKQKRILLDNASLASQAVGPPNNEVEMAWHARTFPELGRKMLQLPPLALQEIDRKDSVLGKYSASPKKGFKKDLSYAELIGKAFPKEYWSSEELTPDGYTQMEANFAMFWGLSIMLYESTLVSDESPFDKYIDGDESAISSLAKEGLNIFLNEGKCINCHSGPEFTGAAISQLRGVLADRDEPMVEFMEMQ
ncbi:MAG: cytochrome-c peroxidase, partial [Planctomycetaceae bacterium]|nr:cytochrome-c peroxidase [Planctomycetaceae bacterium]